MDGLSADYAKSYDAVVFDVLKVTPEMFAVSKTVGVKMICPLLENSVGLSFCVVRCIL